MTLHATITTLLRHDLFQYAQSGDPGAVGAGKNWLDTTTASAPVWKRRNDADNAWITMATGGGGGAALEVTDGTVDVNNVIKITVTAGTLTDNGSGHVTITTGGGGGVGSELWEPLTIQTMLTTELNALAAGDGTALGTAYDNGDAANRYFFGDFQLSATWAASPAANGTVDLYVVGAPDGTNYNDGGTTVRPQNMQRGIWDVRLVNTLQLMTIHGVVLPPYPFKIFVVNNTDQALTASGHTVKMKAYRREIV